MLRRFMKFIVLLVIFCALAAGQQTPSPAQWRDDLAFLKKEIVELHPDPFRRAGSPQFDAAVQDLERRLPSLSREESLVGVMQLVAMLRDGHTSVMPGALERLGERILPMRFYWYSDGLYLQAADRKYRDLLGKKLLAIGNTPAEDVLRRLSTVVSKDNDFTVRDRLPAYLVFPALLRGLHVLAADEPVRLTFHDGAATKTVEVDTVAPPPQHTAPGFGVAYSDDWVDSAAATLPPWLQNVHRPYWSQLLPASGTLYVQYNLAANDPSEPMARFAREVQQKASQPTVQRAVLDLRLNSGGDGYWNKPLLLAFLRSLNLDQKGKLFVLIGRKTFSAGSVLAVDMQKLTTAVFVGEPSGGAVQNFGNHVPVMLPNSKLVVMIATKFYQNDGPFDDADAVYPEVAVDLAQHDYEVGRDPAVEAVVSYVPLSERLAAALEHAAPVDFRRIYDAFAHESMNRYARMEPVLNELGYRYLRAGDTSRAVRLFEIATEEVPRSANAFDSLGDAYAAAGNKQRAIESYRHALQINPDWQPSRMSLQKLLGEQP